MKTYKNKRTGEVAEEYPDYYRTKYWNTINDIPKRLIEDSCDWEEVVEKDWEILSFRHVECSDEWVLKNNSYCNGDACYSLKEMLFDKHTSLASAEIVIYSVRRLSDNDVFSVGNRAQTIGKYPHTISSIEIRQKNKNRNEKDGIDRIWLNWENDCGGNWLEDTEKVKESILTTVDGFELFGGESIYSVTDDFQLCYVSIATKENVQRYKIFAKKENAEEYVKQYKNYKTVGGRQIVEGDNFYVYDKKRYKCLFGTFGTFKSSKWDCSRYRTEEEVLQKIREEKPQYSLNQVKKSLLKYLRTDTFYERDKVITILKNLQNEQ